MATATRKSSGRKGPKGRKSTAKATRQSRLQDAVRATYRAPDEIPGDRDLLPFDQITFEDYLAELEFTRPVPNVELGRKGRRHMVIPDTQMKPGADNRIMAWLGHFAVDQKPDVIVHIGDHWDMPSLGSWEERGSYHAENRRYWMDVWAGNVAMGLFMDPIIAHWNRYGDWWPELHFFVGNHENRINRWALSDARVSNVIGLHHLDLEYWTVHPFLQPHIIDGVKYAHFFPRSASGRITQQRKGQANARLQTQRERMSATAGHMQGLDTSIHHAGEITNRGVIAGSCYLHREHYMEAGEGNRHWRGCLIKNEVHDGNYDLTEVSIHYLYETYGR